jgi:pyruvate dehydrogenase E1 component alpha subunit
MADHTTADDAARYRPPEEVAAWLARDPLLRLERFMAGRGLADDAYAAEVRTRAQALIDAAVAEMEAIAPPQAALMFAHTRADLSPRQAAQKEGR